MSFPKAVQFVHRNPGPYRVFGAPSRHIGAAYREYSTRLGDDMERGATAFH